MFLFWKDRILKELGISPERASILGVRSVRIRGVRFLVRSVTPGDFLGYEHHPMAPWREAKDRMADVSAQKQLEAEFNDPARAKQAMERYMAPMRSLLMKGILFPKLSDKDEPGKVFVDDIFTDMNLANGLIAAIGDATLGEKKTLLSGIFSGERPSNLTR